MAGTFGSQPTQFRLTSTQTALALILPKRLCSEINSLRRVYDKSYSKWTPHINILYPFVEPLSLPGAIRVLTDCLWDKQQSSINVSIDEVDVFRHRKNATVFLKPNVESTEMLCQLRSLLVESLGCKEGDGTHDGVYRPHMSVGQATLTGDSIKKLVGKAEKLVGIAWRGYSLVIMQRSPSGKMEPIEELPLGDKEPLENAEICTLIDTGWSPCSSFASEIVWAPILASVAEQSIMEKSPFDVSILTYNIMAESYAPAFFSRLPLIIDAISGLAARSNSVKVLCLQEVNEESEYLVTNYFSS